MTRLLGTLLIVAILIGGLGYWLGWFQFTKTGNANEMHIGVNVDKERIREDIDKAKDKATETEKKVEDKFKNKGSAPEQLKDKSDR